MNILQAKTKYYNHHKIWNIDPKVNITIFMNLKIDLDFLYILQLKNILIHIGMIILLEIV
jgi:hypothetical protein